MLGKWKTDLAIEKIHPIQIEIGVQDSPRGDMAQEEIGRAGEIPMDVDGGQRSLAQSCHHPNYHAVSYAGTGPQGQRNGSDDVTAMTAELLHLVGVVLEPKQKDELMKGVAEIVTRSVAAARRTWCGEQGKDGDASPATKGDIEEIKNALRAIQGQQKQPEQ